MRANTWAGRNKVEVREVPDPSILSSRDAIVRITSTAICGSDLHLVDGYVPTMQDGDVIGHEFMGEVVEVGSGISDDRLRIGDRVVVPFPISCGACAACSAELYSLCENSNPNSGLAEKLFGHPVAGIFGYSHLTGGFAGGQAEYARVPFASRPAEDIESDSDRRTGAVLVRRPSHRLHGCGDVRHPAHRRHRSLGAGPVGSVCHGQRAGLLGASKVIAIDKEPNHWRWLSNGLGTPRSTLEEVDVRSRLLELTGGRGPDKCIDAVGMEAHHG